MRSFDGGRPRRNSGQGGWRQDRGSARDAPNDTVEKHWTGYLGGGYFEADGSLKVEYVSREKVEPLVVAMCKDETGQYWKDAPTSHQIRRYFGHCRAIEIRLKAAGVSWQSERSKVEKLDIAAADGVAKSPRKIPPLYHSFIKLNVAAIKTKDDFLRGFLPHFEAVVGFGAAHFKKERS